MKSNQVFQTAILCFGVIASMPAAGQAFEKRSKLHTNGEYEIEMTGHFSKSGVVSPGQPIFAFERRSKQYGDKLKWTFAYIFEARTGEKTFNMLDYSSVSVSRGSTKKIVPIFFETGTAYSSVFVGHITDFGCSGSEKIQFKLNKLEGNSLDVQVLLPDCAK